MKRLTFLLLFCGNAYAACPGGATSVDSATTTDAAIHTALASGSVCVTGSSSVTVDQTVTIPSTNVLYTDSGVTLAVTTGGQITMTGSGTIDGFTISTSNVQFPLKVEGTGGITPTIQNITCIGATGTPGNGCPYVVQTGTPAGPTITNNTYVNAGIYAEIMNGATISNNTFDNDTGVEPSSIQCLSCKNVTVDGNTIVGGTTGILFLHSWACSGCRKATEGNTVSDNVVSGISEESISFETNSGSSATDAIREYDTVASTTGTNQVTLADAGWTGDSSYASGEFYLGFITGALAGEYYKISSKTNGTMTLTGMTADLIATINVGDAVWLGLPIINNTIVRNRVTISGASSYGIVLYGTAFDNTVGGSRANANIVIVEEGATTKETITCTSLDDLHTGTVTGNALKGPCDGNTFSYNRMVGGKHNVGKFIDCAGSCAEDTTPDYAIVGNTDIHNSQYNLITVDMPIGYTLKPKKRR